jgi:hypothetical protein
MGYRDGSLALLISTALLGFRRLLHQPELNRSLLPVFVVVGFHPDPKVLQAELWE